MADRIRLDFDVRGNMLRWLNRHGYFRREMIVRDIIGPFYKLLAADLRQGRTRWPVRTGYSKRNFFGRRDGLYNRADYAKYVEGYTKVIRRYLRGNFGSLMRRLVRRPNILERLRRFLRPARR